VRAITAEAVRELHELEANNGTLTPQAVVQRAKNKASALHDLFSWDDKEAARLRRLDEARTIIMSVRVQLETRPDQPPVRVRAFVSLADDRLTGGGYRSIQVVMSNPTQRAQLLRTAIQEFGALKKKYESLSELAQVYEALELISVGDLAKTG